MKMEEEHYKMYGEKTGKIAGAIKCKEEAVKEVCEEVNKGGLIKDILTYDVISEEECIGIQRNLVKKILEGDNQ